MDNTPPVRSGQLIEKEVNLRGEQDMVNEAARELTGLAKYTAYAKVLQEQGKSLWTGEIRTLELRAENDVQENTLETFAHVQLRGEIQKEIRDRHERLIRIFGEQGPPPAKP